MESLIAMTIVALLATIGATVLVIAENRRLRRENADLAARLHDIVNEQPTRDPLWDSHFGLIEDGYLEPAFRLAGAAFPRRPTVGTTFHRTDLGLDFRYDGSGWKRVD
jgi:hypothetical protein